MIYESAPWKRDLVSDADLIERWCGKPASERRSFIIEKKVFVGAFSVRKLIEASRLSASFSGQSVQVKSYPANGARVHRFNNHHFDRHYWLENPEIVSLSAARLMDLIIHSFTFIEVVDEAESIEAFLLTSDRTRMTRLYEVPINVYTKLLRSAGTDFPAAQRYQLDDKSGDFRLVLPEAGEPS